MKDVPATKDGIVTGRIVPSLWKEPEFRTAVKNYIYMEMIRWIFLYQAASSRGRSLYHRPPKGKTVAKITISQRSSFYKRCHIDFCNFHAFH